MKTREITGYYGSNKTKSTIFVSDNPNGSHWYTCLDSVNVNCTYDEIEEGCNIEELNDFDFFTASKPIQDLGQFEQQIES
jgi:hypothetical protein